MFTMLRRWKKGRRRRERRQRRSIWGWQWRGGRVYANTSRRIQGISRSAPYVNVRLVNAADHRECEGDRERCSEIDGCEKCNQRQYLDDDCATVCVISFGVLLDLFATVCLISFGVLLDLFSFCATVCLISFGVLLDLFRRAARFSSKIATYPRGTYSALI